MAISLRDLLHIPYFSPVTVEAGEKGLDRIVNSTTTLDYEYAKGYEMTQQVFLRHDLLSPGVNDMVFYTKLSTAVRIYLLNTDIEIIES